MLVLDKAPDKAPHILAEHNRGIVKTLDDNTEAGLIDFVRKVLSPEATLTDVRTAVKSWELFRPALRHITGKKHKRGKKAFADRMANSEDTSNIVGIKDEVPGLPP